ncbi:hypothetical protein [Xanthocytophaga agilis]|uniref:Lipoprotein n=1 Tax=Xanthocytophaga agilis TaxID=3048010 RepID=A0AAE3UGE0_9BACT|nr:hypothetical protein [Xanthocytophaga agilis]MDJ1504838.1 hypothetical protein [Xanthocytophaga agilis]
MKLTYLIVLIWISALLSCQKKKDTVKRYRNDIPIEATSLSLYPNNEFELTIHADYYSRTSSGKFQISNDTLILNPSQLTDNLIDSVVSVYNNSITGTKVIQLYKREFVYGFGHIQIDTISNGSFYSDPIYVNTDTTELSYNLDSASVAFIPDSIKVNQIRYQPMTTNNCQSKTVYIRKVSNPKANLFKVYINNLDSEKHYLHNWKWLIKGDTIFPYYLNGCEPNKSYYLLLEDVE